MRIRTSIKYQGAPIIKAVGDPRLLARTLSDRFKPNKEFMNLMGEVLREGFRGGSYPTTIRVGRKNAGISYGGQQRYPRGIMRGISPDGESYTELSEYTKKKKRQLGSPHVEDPLQRRSDVDRMALKNSLAVSTTWNTADLRFRDATMNKRSLVHEGGSKGYWSPDGGWTDKYGEKRYVKIPPRPHRGIQPMVARVVNRLTREWLRKGLTNGS